MPRGRNWPVPGRPRVVVRYGRPLAPEEGEGARAFNVRVGQAVARLWAEEDLGWYGSLRAQAEGRAGAADRAGSGRDRSAARAPVTAAASSPPAKVVSWRRTWESTRPLAPRRRRSAWQES